VSATKGAAVGGGPHPAAEPDGRRTDAARHVARQVVAGGYPV